MLDSSTFNALNFGVISKNVMDFFPLEDSKIHFHSMPLKHAPEPRVVCMLGCFRHVQLFLTLWTVARQAPRSMGFSRQEYQNGLPCPPPTHRVGWLDLPNPGIKPTAPVAPAWQATSLPLSHQGSPGP